MTSKARIAVVGAGLIGRKHVEVVAAHAQLDAIVDPDPAAEALAKSHRAMWFSDLEAYLTAAKPDGAIIATPNSLHLPGGEALLRAGVPVLIEKPLAENKTSGRRLLEIEQETGTPILVGHHRRHSPIAKEARHLIKGGHLGRLVTINAMFWLNKPDDYFQATWRTKQGGGPTYINLIHDIDLLQFFCGPISHVQAREGNAVRGFEVEDTSAVILQFASGVIGTVSICDATSSPWSWELTSGENPAYPKTDQACYQIGGTKGALSIPDMRFWTHEGTQSWWSPIQSDRRDIPGEDPIIGQFFHFLDVVRGVAGPLVTAEEGLRNIDVLDAIKRAASQGDVQEVGA